MKSPNKTFIKKYTGVSVLLISLPLLMLGGCAGGNSVKSNNETAQFENDLNAAPVEEQIFNEPVNRQLVESENQQTSAAADEIDTTSENDRSQVITSVETEGGEIQRNQNSTSENVIPEPEEKIISFAFNQSEVSDEYGELLWQYAQYLKENQGVVLNVSGHTDSSGARVYNEALSKKRADQVANILLEFGAPADRLKVTGEGSEKPLANAVLNREHRRVELGYSNIEEVMVSSAE
ncbi:hypothetical protein MNBD_GAMMA09-1600 [hydrothermal vent metagenome]|uniref:OmpA-like domain-containing protein n=1 Tax=hydrothermal vent metagenome TaxID=652676 RepID=A0A3B0XZW1_9ZZZZ